MTIRKLEYEVSFLTPAFLGNAEQSAQWRTPPFKALLRQWWRVAVAESLQYDFARIREAEGRLFGHAWLETDKPARKSLVLLRLDNWKHGTMGSWPDLGGDGRVKHPELGMRVGADLYLGFGPLVNKHGTVLKCKPAIQAGDRARLSLAVPAEKVSVIQHTLWLIDRFGTIGGRSRNGWGSLSIVPVNGTPTLQGDLPLRNWEECLSLDWAHALGKDEQGLLAWQTQPFDDWRMLVKELAEIKIWLLTRFPFTGKNASYPAQRHWLSYPVTKHKIAEWDEAGLRIPNSLRFKIRHDPENRGQLHGLIFHMPCLPPPDFNPDKETITNTWRQVHDFLSQNQNLTRVQE